jgi:hypothetical protein
MIYKSAIERLKGVEWGRIKKMKRIVGYELALEDLMIYRRLEIYNIISIMEYLQEFG